MYSFKKHKYLWITIIFGTPLLILLNTATTFGAYLLFLGLLIMYIAVMLVVFAYSSDKEDKINSERAAEEQRLNRQYQQEAVQKYRQQLAPVNWTHWQKITISNSDANILGRIRNPIKYMYIDNNHVITFPESRYGNNAGYYLISIRFQKKVAGIFNGTSIGTENGQGSINLNGNQSINGATVGGNTLRKSYNDPNVVYGGYGGVFHGNGNINLSGNNQYNGNINSNTNGHIKYVEHPTYALLTFVTIDFHQSFTIRLLNVKSDVVSYIQQYYELNQVQKQKLGLIK